MQSLPRLTRCGAQQSIDNIDEQCGDQHNIAWEIVVRIAQIAPLSEPVPPKLYGGTERVVSHLTEELVRQGHHVTLFASGDSETSAELAACCERGLRP